MTQVNNKKIYILRLLVKTGTVGQGGSINDDQFTSSNIKIMKGAETHSTIFFLNSILALNKWLRKYH